MTRIYIILAILVSVSVAIAWGPIMSNVEQAKYIVLKQSGSIEIRDYEQMVVAEVEVHGDRESAINKGFRIIADYIFGNNLTEKKVAMTAPVSQQESVKIAMTAPVTQTGDGVGSWKVNFVMPYAYTLKTLPKPRNDLVKLREIPAKRYVVIRFSGIAKQKRLDLERNKLKDFMQQRGLEPVGYPVYAFFNPPWTLPFLRRNEIMIEIKK